jgi:coproporphyrinogen III oxidase-like Fe-S oxidoreductase
MMVGLRMMRGVNHSDFHQQFGRNMEDVFGLIIQRLLKNNLLQATVEGYRLSNQGILYGNNVFAEFLGLTAK